MSVMMIAFPWKLTIDKALIRQIVMDSTITDIFGLDWRVATEVAFERIMPLKFHSSYFGF
jgi:hypothetical protein